ASWRGILGELCSSVLDSGDFPAAVRDLCLRLQHTPVAHLEAQADALLAGRVAEVDAAAGPFLMSALQVCWLDLAAQFTAEEVKPLEVTGVCPLAVPCPLQASFVSTRARAGTATCIARSAQPNGTWCGSPAATVRKRRTSSTTRSRAVRRQSVRNPAAAAAATARSSIRRRTPGSSRSPMTSQASRSMSS